MNCPHCQAEISEQQFRSLRGQFASGQRKNNAGGRPKKVRARVALNAGEAYRTQAKVDAIVKRKPAARKVVAPVRKRAAVKSFGGGYVRRVQHPVVPPIERDDLDKAPDWGA